MRLQLTITEGAGHPSFEFYRVTCSHAKLEGSYLAIALAWRQPATSLVKSIKHAEKDAFSGTLVWKEEASSDVTVTEAVIAAVVAAAVVAAVAAVVPFVPVVPEAA